MFKPLRQRRRSPSGTRVCCRKLAKAFFFFNFLSGDGGTAAVRAEDQRSDASGAADGAGGHHRVPEGSGGDRSHTPSNVSPALTFQLRRVVASWPVDKHIIFNLNQSHQNALMIKGFALGLDFRRAFQSPAGPSSAQTRLSVAQDTPSQSSLYTPVGVIWAVGDQSEPLEPERICPNRSGIGLIRSRGFLRARVRLFLQNKREGGEESSDRISLRPNETLEAM